MALLCLLLLSLFWTREIAGYDFRYNKRKHFTIRNKAICRILMPKRLYKHDERVKADLNRMTYAGAILYISNLIVACLSLVLLFVLPQIPSVEVEGALGIFRSIETLNEKIPLLLMSILNVAEILCLAINVMVQSKLRKSKAERIMEYIVGAGIILAAIAAEIIMIRELILWLV